MVSRIEHAILKALSACLAILLGVSGKQRLSILTYHRVMPVQDPMRPLEPTLSEFEWQMELISNCFTPLALTEALQLMAVGKLPSRAICVTFDDGYSDNEKVALPVLRRFSVPATVFVSTGFLNGGRMWNDTVIEAMRYCKGPALDLRAIGLAEYKVGDMKSRREIARDILGEIKHWSPDRRAHAVTLIQSISMTAALPEDLMMTDDQVKIMSDAGMEIGAHTVNHPILASLEQDHAKVEIYDSRQYLETLLGRPVSGFAYPNGKPSTDYSPIHRELVKEVGFDYAVSTKWGVCTGASDRWQLPRFTPWDKTRLRFLVRLLFNLRHPT